MECAVINSLAHQGQIDGGFVTGLGLAVTEELVSEGGQILNGHLGEYKLPTIADIPPLETVLVPTSGGEGPYQAKAIGEWPTTPRQPLSPTPWPMPSAVSSSAIPAEPPSPVSTGSEALALRQHRCDHTP